MALHSSFHINLSAYIYTSSECICIYSPVDVLAAAVMILGVTAEDGMLPVDTLLTEMRS